MTLTRELRTTLAFTLAIVLALTAFVWGNQRQVHANVVDVNQILCYVDQAGNALDGDTGTFPVFKLDNCGGGSPIVDWCPTIDGNQTQADLPCIPPETDYCPLLPGVQSQTDPCIPPVTDLCPNIDGLQATVPEGKVVDGNGNCVDAHSGGSSSDLSITKTVSTASPTPSSTVTYTIVVHNSGPDAAANVSVNDVLPSGVTFVSSDSSAYASTTGVWTIGTMASGTDATLHITATVAAIAGTQVSNTATIAHSDSTDGNSDNNSSTVTFTSTAEGQGGGGGSPECSDGIDNDQDGEIDFPADSGCSDANDDSEASGSTSGGSSHHHSSGGSSSNNGGGEVLGAETECPMYLTGYIKYGATNDSGEVAKLQTFLNAYEGNTLAVTGTYNQATLAAVNAFQRKYAADVLEPWGLKGTTGYVYYTTQKEVNTIYCKFQKDFPLSAAQLQEITYVRQIQPTLHAKPAATAGAGTSASSPAKATTSPAVGSVVLPATTKDENAGKPGATSQTAATANASSSQGWFGKFIHWLFGK